MAGNKYLERDATSGRMKELASVNSSAGAGDADKIVSLNASGEIDGSMLPPGVGANALSIEAFEALAANDLVEIFDDGGTPKARLANAASGSIRPAIGFVTAAHAATTTAIVYFEGRIPGGTYTPGDRVYLSTTTPGGTQTAVPTGTGNISQYIGKAVSATEVNFEPDDAIELA